MKKPSTALVLAGGKSLRLGRDKVMLSYCGESLLERMVRLAASFCPRVVVSGRDPGGLGLDIPWLPDETTGLGPLGGILTGLRRLRGPLLVLACDLPVLDRNTLLRLFAAWERRPESAVMTTFLQPDTGYIESLVAIYEQAAEPFLSAAAAGGLFKLSRAIPPEYRWHVPYTHAESGAFFNVNFPADFALLERMSDPEEAV